MKIYELFVDGDEGHTPLFVTSRREADRFLSDPDCDHTLVIHDDVCEVLSDQAEVIRNLGMAVVDAAEIMVFTMPFNDGKIDRSKYNRIDARTHNWIVNNAPHTAEVYGLTGSLDPGMFPDE